MSETKQKRQTSIFCDLVSLEESFDPQEMHFHFTIVIFPYDIHFLVTINNLLPKLRIKAYFHNKCAISLKFKPKQFPIGSKVSFYFPAYYIFFSAPEM